jgi:hypothetical protein
MLSLYLLAGLLAAGQAGAAAAELSMLPAVRSIIDRRRGCDHWAGEEPYDRERARQIAAAARRLQCDRLDRDEAAVRRNYSARGDVLRLMDQASAERP